MRNIEKAVQNVVDKSKEIDYDPEHDPNWCHLPMEIRMKCIRNMNFKTRTRLSVTSTIEKSLVESEKFHLDTILLDDMGPKLCVVAHDSFEGTNFHVLFDAVNLCEQEWPTKMQFLRYVLKMCKVDEFSSKRYPDESAERERIDPEIDLADFVPFGFKKIKITYKCCGNVVVLLDNCPNLEVVFLESCRETAQVLDHPAYVFGELTANLPPKSASSPIVRRDFTEILLANYFIQPTQVINVKDIRIANCVDWTALFKLVEKWIEMNANVGKSMQYNIKLPIHDGLVVAFKQRLIERTDEYVRIRMDDPTKQILSRRIGKDPSDEEYFSFKVIPMDLPESEYGKGDEWITQLFEKAVDDQDADFSD